MRAADFASKPFVKEDFVRNEKEHYENEYLLYNNIVMICGEVMSFDIPYMYNLIFEMHQQHLNVDQSRSNI